MDSVPMTIDRLTHVVADDFLDTMKDFDFASFAEMVRCYMWDTKDIKEQVNMIIDEYARSHPEEGLFYLDDDGTDIICNDDIIPYRTFSQMFRKLLK